mgnify:FL=1
MNERIKELRKTLSLTQKEFGKRLGVTDGAISFIEKGERNLTDQMILAISKEFNVNETWIRTGEGEMFSKVKNVLVDELVDNYKFNATLRNIVNVYWSLEKEKRVVIDNFVKTVARAILGDEVISVSDVNNIIKNAITDIVTQNATTETGAPITTGYAARTVDGSPPLPPNIPDLSKIPDDGEDF